MSGTGVALCLLLFAATPAAAARVQSTNKVGTSGGPHKCTITWTPREGQTASVTFGVSKCRAQCTATNFDGNHDAMFPLTFVKTETVQSFGQRCTCTDATGLQVSFVGKCGDASADKRKCWKYYKMLSTDRFEKATGRNGGEEVIVQHNEPMTRSNTFNYNNPVCEENGLSDDPDSVEGFLPGLSVGRSKEEKHIFAEALIQHEHGEDIAKDVEDIVSALTEEEIQLLKQGECALFNEYLNKEVADAEAENRLLTVRELKVAYEAKLKGTGLSVEHLITVAGWDAEADLDAVLTCPRFATFLKPGTFGDKDPESDWHQVYPPLA